MEITTSTDIHLQFVGEHSEEIFSKKEHVLVGISPCNSYYTKIRIEQILIWVLAQGFKNFHFYTGDEMWFYNYQAFGYSAQEARTKMQEKNKQLLAKLRPLLQKYQISEDRIIYFDTLIQNENYRKYRAEYEKLIIEDQFFFQTISALVQHLKNTGQRKDLLYPHFAYQAIALELPLILRFPNLFHCDSSLFIYHQNNSMYEYIYHNKNLKHATQSFINLHFE